MKNYYFDFYSLDTIDGDNIIELEPETLRIQFARKVNTK